MKHALRKISLAVAGLLLAPTLSSCSLLSRPDSAATYQLSSHRPTDANKQSASHARVQSSVLVIQTPASSRVLDSDRVIIAQQGGRLAAWEGLRWADAAPVLLRDKLVEAFVQDGRQVVRVDNTSFGSERELLGTLRAFQFEQRGDAPVVTIRLDLQLDNHDRLIAGPSRRFEIARKPASKRDTDVIAAFNAASDALAEEVVDWVLHQPVDPVLGAVAAPAPMPRSSPAGSASFGR